MLSTNKVSDEGIAKLLEVVDGQSSELAKLHSGSPLEVGQD